MSNIIHRDLLAIIFAYTGLSRRSPLSSISRQCQKIAESYTYIISLGRIDINCLFKYVYKNNKIEWLPNCLKNPLLYPAIRNNHAIRLSSLEGYLEIVKLLLADSRVDPADLNNNAIEGASHEGHTEIVKLLLAHPQINLENNRYNLSLRWASENGHLEVVKLLLADGRINPTNMDNLAVKMAYIKKHIDVYNLLFADKRVYDSLTESQRIFYRILSSDGK